MKYPRSSLREEGSVLGHSLEVGYRFMVVLKPSWQEHEAALYLWSGSTQQQLQCLAPLSLLFSPGPSLWDSVKVCFPSDPNRSTHVDVLAYWVTFHHSDQRLILTIKLSKALLPSWLPRERPEFPGRSIRWGSDLTRERVKPQPMLRTVLPLLGEVQRADPFGGPRS